MNHDDPATSATIRYKEITAAATTAVQRMRRHENEKAHRLHAEVIAGKQRIADAEHRREKVAEGVRIRWNATREALRQERWMRLSPLPDADRSAAPATSDDSIRAIQAAFLVLYDAVGKSRWSAGSLLPKARRYK